MAKQIYGRNIGHVAVDAGNYLCCSMVNGLRFVRSANLFVSIVVTGLEQLSGYGLDNLSVPLATASLISLISESLKAT